MTKKRVVYIIEHCNGRCPHFYYNYEDNENIWCDLLERRVFETQEYTMSDSVRREIPKDCPLQDVDE